MNENLLRDDATKLIKHLDNLLSDINHLAYDMQSIDNILDMPGAVSKLASLLDYCKCYMQNLCNIYIGLYRIQTFVLRHDLSIEQKGNRNLTIDSYLTILNDKRVDLYYKRIGLQQKLDQCNNNANTTNLGG